MKCFISHWTTVALVGVFLSAAALAVALTTDNRDYTARQAAAVRSSAL
jgi:hypothetical protein